MRMVGITILAFAAGFCVLMIFAMAISYGDHKNATPKDAIKLSFDELKRFYKIAPKKYFLGDYIIQYYLESDKAVYVRLSLIDFLKYSIWIERLAKKNTDDARDANMKAYLESTDRDIEVYKKEAQEYLKSILNDSELKALAKYNTDADNVFELCKKLRIIAERMVETDRYREKG